MDGDELEDLDWEQELGNGDGEITDALEDEEEEPVYADDEAEAAEEAKRRRSVVDQTSLLTLPALPCNYLLAQDYARHG